MSVNFNTLRFEEINNKAFVINKNTVPNFPIRPGNQSNPRARTYAYQSGALGQTEGNYQGDNLPQLPACAYHMPRNAARFNEPGLFIEKKKPGDIISAKDMNYLIERIKLFMYVWDAESNDIYGYGGYDKTLTRKIKVPDTMKRIIPELGSYPNWVHDTRSMGQKDNAIVYDSFWYMASGTTITEVGNLLNNQKGNPEIFDYTMNKELPFGVPELRVAKNNINQFYGGYTNLVTIKPVQYFIGAYPSNEQYYLKYTDTGELIKDQNGVPRLFDIGTPYYFNFRDTNEPDAQLKWVGLISYKKLIAEQSGISENSTVTKVEYPAQRRIHKKYRAGDKNHFGPSLDDTVVSEFTSGITPVIEGRTYNFSSWKTGHLNPRKTITMPSYKIENNTVYIKNHTETNWRYAPDNTFFVLHSIEYDAIKKYSITTSSGTPPTSTTTEYEIQDIHFSFLRYKITNTNELVIGIEDSSYSSMSMLIDNGSNDPLTNSSRFSIHPNLLSDIGFENMARMCSTWYEYPLNLIYVKRTDTTLNENNVIMDPGSASEYMDIYQTELFCGDSISATGICVIESTGTNITTSAAVDTGSGLIVNESDIYLNEPTPIFGTGKFPIIKAQDYKKAQLSLRLLLQAVRELASIGINDGTPDTITVMTIGTFLTQEADQGLTFNKDDPETTFMGYQAKTDAIIKYQFYNTLVDAYKILINGCVCNADCSCNINCICNVNCGCNYGLSWLLPPLVPLTVTP